MKYREKKKTVNTEISGAPELRGPVLITDSDGNVLFTEKIGRAYPMLFDWDRDGVKDIILGLPSSMTRRTDSTMIS